MHHPVKTGLLGGSFNPAHAGHVYISERALELLGLDEIWWLVSPQNPTKPTTGMAPFSERVTTAKTLVKDAPYITVSDFEQSCPTDDGQYYTYHTLRALQSAYPDRCFTWLMGADNLVNFHHWKHWQEIFATLPIAIFDRGHDQENALKSQAATAFASHRIAQEHARRLPTSRLPAWCFLQIPTHPASSSGIRGK